jgi:hypothetical protein
MRISGRIFWQYALLVTVAATLLLPLVWAFVAALKPLDQIYAEPPEFWPRTTRWGNFGDAFTRLPFARFMLNSLVIALPATAGAVLTSAMAGYAFARIRWTGRRFWQLATLAALLIPANLLLVPHFMAYGWLGWINTYKPLIAGWAAERSTSCCSPSTSGPSPASSAMARRGFASPDIGLDHPAPGQAGRRHRGPAQLRVSLAGFHASADLPGRFSHVSGVAGPADVPDHAGQLDEPGAGGQPDRPDPGGARLRRAPPRLAGAGHVLALIDSGSVLILRGWWLGVLQLAGTNRMFWVPPDRKEPVIVPHSPKTTKPVYLEPPKTVLIVHFDFD